MLAFKVHLNNRKVCLAGVGEDGVLTTILTWVSRKGRADTCLEVGGLVSLTKEHVRWAIHKPVKVGDRIQIRICEAKSVDRPRKTFKANPQADLRAEKRYVRMMAKKFGWRIQDRA
ncbi:MAG TPA: hypothetical protein VLT90_17275 [Terriglobales bacterium]|nr:hypothetical protein [Terriglobales bacterium]